MRQLDHIVVNLKDKHLTLELGTLIGNDVQGVSVGSEDYFKLNLETGCLTSQREEPFINLHNWIYSKSVPEIHSIIYHGNKDNVQFANDEWESWLNAFIMASPNEDPGDVEREAKAQWLNDNKLHTAIKQFLAMSERMKIKADTVTGSLLTAIAEHQVEGDSIRKGLKARGINIEKLNSLQKNYLGGYTQDQFKNFEDLLRYVEQQGE